MAFAHYPTSIRLQASKHPKTSILKPPPPSPSFSSLTLPLKPRNLSLFSRPRIPGHKGNYTSPPSAQAEPQGPRASSAADAFTNFKHLLLPITDGNPYLSEGTRQAIATVAALAKKYGSDITVVVIDDQQKESLPEHETQLSTIRWHLSEGGFQEYKLLERLGEGNKPTAIIGEVADDLNLDLVVISMEAIHSKHIDANLLAEFIPCPVILLPL
ncbi:uncharacterized protein LOC103953446 [Pyrus x bretschneideri]|uniref:uncharacterized protein LOC103953446 n=1 Tax=Pyrus x bretschneideri TaxID=225117 RepID=UPI0020306C8F|nr:uncharacterized protein LOC103953446 [Pyrus x bretschneideri]